MSSERSYVPIVDDPREDYLVGRHPAVRHLHSLFDWSHLPPELAWASEACQFLASRMIQQVSDGPELTVGLRKLLEAKDCFVRAIVTEGRE